jgi:TetR/AcrR family transcriptional repressor of nem operon
VLEHWFATHVAHSIDVPEGSPRRGCLLLNSAAEAPELDADSAACVQSQLQALEQLFRSCVGEARRLEPRDDRPGPAATARLLLAALAGISALSRAGAEPRVLRDAARCALHLV